MSDGKKILMAVGGIILAVILIFSGWMVSTKNGIARADNAVQESWENVSNQYNRRASLIKQLVPVVKESARSEAEILEKALGARYTNATPDPAKLDASESGITSALNKLMVVQEQYPNLKSQDNFKNLMTQIEGSENRIAVARTNYNGKVREYNDKVTQFPASMIGGPKKQGFQSQPGDENAPNINFGG